MTEIKVGDKVTFGFSYRKPKTWWKWPIFKTYTTIPASHPHTIVYSDSHSNGIETIRIGL